MFYSCCFYSYLFDFIHFTLLSSFLCTHVLGLFLILSAWSCFIFALIKHIITLLRSVLYKQSLLSSLLFYFQLIMLVYRPKTFLKREINKETKEEVPGRTLPFCRFSVPLFFSISCSVILTISQRWEVLKCECCTGKINLQAWHMTMSYIHW